MLFSIIRILNSEEQYIGHRNKEPLIHNNLLHLAVRMDPVTDNKRIAKNTIFLYIRQFVIMGVTLFTFRMVVELLGINDFGTYNVIGGIVILFSFISGALTQSTQRYLSFQIGKNDATALQQVFSMSLNIYGLACIVILILAETIGLWFVNKYLEFPTGDIFAANVVYQCTIISLLFQILQLPYQAAIISFEKMNFFAYLSILEAILKLVVVIILFSITTNRLIWYAASLSGVSILICITYKSYCTQRFTSCKYSQFWNKQTFKELISFGGWNLLGSASNVATQQGINILFNIFIGVSVNAAMGVANQVCNAVNTFVTNFQTAFNPQIIKLYAMNEQEAFFNLIFRASRISFMLLFIIGLPIIICCKPILSLWLTEIPPNSIQFIQLMMVFGLIDALSGPLWVSAQASGRIKWYMILILLRYGVSPIYVILIRVVLNFIIANVRIFYLKHLINLPVGKYYQRVMIPIIIVCLISFPIPLYLYDFTNTITGKFLLFVLTFINSTFLLLTRSEKSTIANKLNRMIHRI